MSSLASSKVEPPSQHLELKRDSTEAQKLMAPPSLEEKGGLNDDKAHNITEIEAKQTDSSPASKLRRRIQEPISPRRSRKMEKDIANYKTEICRTHRALGHCEYEDNCQFAHGIEELRPRQYGLKYKTQLCKNYHRSGHQFGECRFGARCKFVHDEQRVQVGDREFWLISPSDNLVRVEVVQNESRRAELQGLVAQTQAVASQPATPPFAAQYAMAPATMPAISLASHQTQAPVAPQYVHQPQLTQEHQQASVQAAPSYVPVQYTQSAMHSSVSPRVAVAPQQMYSPHQGYGYGAAVPTSPMPYIDYHMQSMGVAFSDLSLSRPQSPHLVHHHKTAQFLPSPRQTHSRLAKAQVYPQSPLDAGTAATFVPAQRVAATPKEQAPAFAAPAAHGLTHTGVASS